MAQELYTQVAYIGLRMTNGSMLLDVPLYVKVNDLSGQEELIHKISAVMIRRYEKQISEYFTNLKKEQKQNEKTDTVSY